MNNMIAQIQSLPGLIRDHFSAFDDSVRTTFDHNFCLSLKRLYVTGCGDSHHVALTTELAFEALAGIPTEPMTALQFARYGVGYIPDTGPGTNAVIGISASGEVSRTLETLVLAPQYGATPIALTATPSSQVGQAGELILSSAIAPFPSDPDEVIPGVRSYLANQLALYLLAVRVGEVRGALTSAEAGRLRKELLSLADIAEKTIEVCAPLAQGLAQEWADAKEFVFAGGGPNFGTALFSAAKVLEASGDPALGQDMEEWAHLQYFTRDESTPTFLITAGDRDLSRAIEVAEAARTIGRRVVAIVPDGTPGLGAWAQATLPLAGHVRELFSPLITAIPGELFSAYRSDILDEPFFRNFGGGRSIEGGGGISRIRESEMWQEFHG